MTTIAILAIILYLISGLLLAYKLRARTNKTASIQKSVYQFSGLKSFKFQELSMCKGNFNDDDEDEEKE